jgi:4-amino-4-deoxy-L-arabinose transferase-like glycosyltransferase
VSERAPRPPLWAWALILAVGVLVYVPWLGSTGLSMTEGHRAIPGFEMLEGTWASQDASGKASWWAPTLFGQVYVRKPPGVSWAIAASASIFGENEFSARLPSALAAIGLAAAALYIGTRWFGVRGGVAAGIAQVLWPLMWASGRSAEIEAMNTAFSVIASWLVIDTLIKAVNAKRLGTEIIRRGFILAAALIGVVLCKGPAGLPIIGASVVAACIVRWSIAPIRDGVMWIALVIACAALLGVWLRMRSAIEGSGQIPVLQGPSEFLWSREKLSIRGLAGVLGMPLLALASALPASLALLFPWGADAPREASVHEAGEPVYGGFAAARAVAIACVLSLALLVLLGVDNPRYAMPSVAVLPMLVGYVAWGIDGPFTAIRRRIARVLLLDSSGRGVGWWPVLLGFAAMVWIFVSEPRSRASSGREAGVSIAPVLSSLSAVAADHLIEARPEVLWYARQTNQNLEGSGAQASTASRKIRWLPGRLAEAIDPASGFDAVMLRSDQGSDEHTRLVPLLKSEGFEFVRQGRVSKFAFEIWQRRR